MQNFKTIRQSLLGELAMSRKKEERKKERKRKNAIYSGQLHFCLQPRAARTLRSDQKKLFFNITKMYLPNRNNVCPYLNSTGCKLDKQVTILKVIHMQ